MLELVKRLLEHSSILHLSLWFFSFGREGGIGPCLSPLPFTGRYSVAQLFPFALRPLLGDSVCQIQGLSLTAALGGSNHLYCSLFHYGSCNTCSSFLYWVPPQTVPVGASLTDVLMLGSPAGCLIVNPRLRLLLDSGTLDGGVVVVHTRCGVLALWRQTYVPTGGGCSHERTVGSDHFDVPTALVRLISGTPLWEIQSYGMLPSTADNYPPFSTFHLLSW
ncbi:hypothetical protein Tco_0136241, partial [Tanacetum coccineum]